MFTATGLSLSYQSQQSGIKQKDPTPNNRFWYGSLKQSAFLHSRGILNDRVFTWAVMLKQWTSPQNYRCPCSWGNMETQTGCLLPRFDLCTGKSIVFSLLCQNLKDPLPIQAKLGFRASQGSHGQLSILPRVPATGTAWEGTGTAQGTEGLCCTQSSEGLQGILSCGIRPSGRGRKAQTITQHKKEKTSSSLKQNNAQNWVLGTTSLRFVIQAVVILVSLIFM